MVRYLGDEKMMAEVSEGFLKQSQIILKEFIDALD